MTNLEPSSSDTSPDTPETPETPEPVKDDAGKEAAKYRRQLREAEAERDGLRTAMTNLQRQQVEDIARREHHLSVPAAVWKAGVEVQSLLGADGALDADLVSAAITAAVTDLGLRVNKPSGLPAAPNAGRESTSKTGPTWGEFLKNG